MPNPSDSSSEYSSDSEEEVLSDNIDIESNNDNHSNEDNNNEDRDNEDNNNDDEEHNDDDNGETSKEKLTTSDVWEFVDKATRKCSSCGKIFKKSTGTSSIRSHLQNHGILLVKAKQTSLDNFVKRHSQKIQSEKTQKVVEWIVLDLQPFKVVEGEAFREMVSKLDPQYQVPSRETIKKAIMKSFEDRKTVVKNFIKNIPGKVALTTDIWSSLKSEGFLGITIHFIDENWILRHFTLDIFRFKGAHTGQAIADEIYRIITEHELQLKAMAITTDNGSNMVSGANILKAKLAPIIFTHYRCVAHILNLIVMAGLNIIKNPIKKLRNLIKLLRKSTKLLEELENLAKADKKTFLRPIMDCKTRWNSTFKMINRACILKEHIEMLLVRYSNVRNYFPDEQEWELFKDLDEFLQQFDDATTELSSQTYPTIAHSRIILLSIKKDLEVNRGEESLLNEMINAMKIKFNEYYEGLEESTHIAAFLDPRYKKYCFLEMSEHEILLPIRNKLEQQLPSEMIPSKKTSRFLQNLKNTTTTPVVNDEISKYWNSIDAEENVKPLEWWKTHFTEYPNLSKLAHDFLCIQASSVPCEQLFSIAGQVLCKSRNRLTGESVRACLCLRSWILEDVN